jgi:hypothetical protein
MTGKGRLLSFGDGLKKMHFRERRSRDWVTDDTLGLETNVIGPGKNETQDSSRRKKGKGRQVDANGSV